VNPLFCNLSVRLEKYFSCFVIAVLLFVFSEETKATHAVGLDIQYECLGGNQYLLTLNLYRDCAGVTAPTAAAVRITSASCGVSATVSLPLSSFSEISPLCPNQLGSSTCNGGSSPGIEQYIYSGNYTFPLQCNDWVISYTLCCRNNAITNLLNPGNYNIYAQATMSNMNNMCNNSPIFTTRPVPFVCAGQTFNYNHGAVDIDGDSLAYSIVNPLDGAGINIPYRSPYNPNNPLSTSGGFNFNNGTGQMVFNPNASQQAVVSVVVREYRNGVLIGTTMRDMQLVVINSCNNINPTASGINGTSNFSIDVCAGYPLCFNIFSNDQNAGQTTTLTLNNGIQGATFNTSGAPFQQAQFCWTSTPADVGPNDFSITVVDNACPYFGSNNYTYRVNVIPNPNPPVNAGPDVDICANACTQLNATGPPSVVRYQWSPATGLSNPNIRNPNACPTVTTTYTVSAVYADSCAATDQVIVRVQPSPNPVVFPKTAVVCAGSSIQLTASSNTPATFQWSNGTTGAVTIATPTANTNYVVTASNTYGCTATDTAFITYSPPPPPQVCNNIYVTPTGTGGGMSQTDPTDIVTAIGLAQCNNLTIKMAIGNYVINNPLQLSSLLTIEGGFDPGNAWRKSSTAGATTIRRSNLNPEGAPNEQRIVAIYANGAQFWRLQDLTIITDNAAATGQEGMSVYGLHLTQCASYDVVRCQILPGNASAGADGSATPGTGGAGGGGTGGAGGTLADGCGNPGPGGNGTAGSGGAAGGTGTDVGGSSGCCGSSRPAAGGSGQNGTNGTSYVAGDRPATPSPTGGFFIPAGQSASGTPGTGGGGGGGGGGSRGGTCVCIDCAGNNGGAGGNGGGGGLGGGGGYGGGSSFAVYLFGGSGNFTDCNINSGTAGNGGNGGAGQAGAAGLAGVAGATNGACVCGNPQGGNGGSGGSGGAGGRGRDGANGMSADFYNDGATATVISGGTNQNINAGVNTITDFNLVAQPAITVENISCTQTPVAYAAGSSSSWNFGSGAAPLTANGTGGSPSYSTTGRKTITFGTNTYTGFHRIAIDNATYFPEIQTTATLISPDTYVVCAGDPIDFFTNTPGIGFNWNMGGGVNPNTYTTANVPGLMFNTPGTYIITLSVVTDCCGPTLPDSVTLIVDNNPNIVLAGDTNICFGETTDISISGGTTYLWTPGVGNISTPTATVTLNPSVTTIYTITANSVLGYCSANANLTVVVNPLPSLTTSSTPASCSNDGSATVNVSGGSGSYSYLWNDANAQTTQTASNIFTGNYSVTVTDNTTGCVNTATVFVSNAGAPVAYIQNSANVSCFGGSDGSATAAVASGTAPFTFAWSTGATTAAISNLAAGNYSVTGTDSRGCFSITSIVISEPSLLIVVVDSIDSVSCFGFSDGAVYISADGGSGGYQYLWNTNPPQTTASASGLTAGTYTVTVSDVNNCTITQDVTVFEPAAMQIQQSTTDAACFNTSDGAASITITSATTVQSYQWSNGNTTNQISNVLPATYYVTVTDINGCSLADTLIVNAPDTIFIDETITDISCFGATDGNISVVISGGTPGNVTPYTVLWTGGSTNTSISNLAQGSYSITATDGSGCTVSETYTIIEPAQLQATLTAQNISCFGLTDGQITVNTTGGTSPFNYSLNGGTSQTGNVYSNLIAGNYDVVVTDAGNCTATANAVIIEPAALQLNVTGNPPRCYGEASGNATATVTGGTVPFNYSWNSSPAQNTPTATDLPDGNYSVTVTDAGGCTITDTITLIQPPPIAVDAVPDSAQIKFGKSIDVTTSFSNTVRGTPTYTWEPTDGLSCTDCPNPVASPVDNTVYVVTLIDSAGCTAQDNILIEVDLDKVLYVPNAFSPDGDGVNDIFYVYTLGAKSIVFKVFDRWGELIFESTDLTVGWDGSFKGKLMNPSVYVYHVEVTYLDNDRKVAKGSVTLIR
jgi:gliding motility-associated-like protein